MRARKLKRDRAADLGFGFLSFIDRFNPGVGIFISWSRNFLEAGFHAFSSLFGQGFPVMALAILGLSSLIWLLVERCHDRPLTFLIAAHDFLYSGLWVSC